MKKTHIDQIVANNIELLMSLNPNVSSQPKLATKSGVGQSTIGRILRRESSPTIEILSKIASALSVTMFELMDPHLTTTREYEGRIKEAKASYEIPGTPYIEVPLVESFYHGGDGDGMERQKEPRFLKTLSFRKDWLEYEGLNPEHLKVAMVHGKSMEPTLSEADVILIDKRENTINSVSNGEIYAITVNNAPLVKRLYKQELGGIVLQSDNKSFKDIEISDIESVDVVGRVVWAGGKVC